jgi:hypothetical protein
MGHAYVEQTTDTIYFVDNSQVGDGHVFMTEDEAFGYIAADDHYRRVACTV